MSKKPTIAKTETDKNLSLDGEDDKLGWFTCYSDDPNAGMSASERREYDFNAAVEEFGNVWGREDFTVGMAFILSAICNSFVKHELERIGANIKPEVYEAMREAFEQTLSSRIKDDENPSVPTTQEVAFPESLYRPDGETVH